MIDNTINDDKTLAGGGKDVTPAGRDHALCRMGGGGDGMVDGSPDYEKSYKLISYGG